MTTPLIFKRGDPSRRREADYDVLEDGKVVGRIFVSPTAPEGRPWMWASGHNGDIRRTAQTGSVRLRSLARYPRRVVYVLRPAGCTSTCNPISRSVRASLALASN